MKNIVHFLRVYKEYLSISLSAASSFRTHFILLILVDVAFYLTTIGSVVFIFDHLDFIGPWNKSQFMFFLSFMLLVDNIHMSLISQNYWEFPNYIKNGTLDLELIKPFPTIFIVFFKYIRIATLFISPIPIALLAYYGMQANLDLASWLILPVFIIFSIVFVVSLEMLLMLPAFWIIEGIGLNFLRMQLQSIARWPDFIFLYFTKKIFTIFIPILLVGSAPVHLLLNIKKWHLMAWMITALLIIWALTYFVWREGLKRYESASS